jgi:hypothetical protein
LAPPPVPRSNRRLRLPPIRLGKIVKLLLLCLLVGLVMSAIGLEPLEFWAKVVDVAARFYGWLVGVFGKLGSDIVIGAAVVIPIWAARALYRHLRR